LATKATIAPLDGLRGIACLCVLFDHFCHWSVPWDDATTPRQKGFWIFGTSGYGMTLFFTLSGFVIAYNYLRLDWANRPLQSYADFAFRRLSRLYPLLIVFFVVASIGHHTADFNGHDIWKVMNFLSMQSWFPAVVAGETAGDGTTFVAWSISTEFMLYTIFAVAMIFAARMSWRAIAVALAIYAAATLVVSHWVADSAAPPFHLFEAPTADQWHAWFFYTSPWSRLAQFALGWAAAWIVVNRKLDNARPTLRALAAGAAVFLAVNYYVVVQRAALQSIDLFVFDDVTALLFAVILLNAQDSSRLNRALSLPVLVGIGEISYSLYLLHPFAPKFGFYYGGAYSADLIPTFLFNLILHLGAAILLAHGAYWLIERPAQAALRALVHSARQRERQEIAQPAE
jgi:peptidoglycan/LPS O-acetylase OafA/YrhL